MRDCLRIGCYDIVVLIRQVDEAGLQWAENALDKHLCLVTRPMLNDDLVCCKNAISKFMCIYLRSISKAPKNKTDENAAYVRGVVQEEKLWAHVMNGKRLSAHL